MNHHPTPASEQLALLPEFSRPYPGLTYLIPLINLISQLMKPIAWHFVNSQGTCQKVNISNGQDQSLGDGALILYGLWGMPVWKNNKHRLPLIPSFPHFRWSHTALKSSHFLMDLTSGLKQPSQPNLPLSPL